MKRFLALLLAASMLTTMAVPVTAATTPSKYPVSGISDDGYLLEDDSSRVDMGKPANRAPYGETIYFPLLSDGSGASASLKTAMDNAKSALDKAKGELTALTSDFTTKERAYNEANEKLKNAKEALANAGTSGGSQAEKDRLKGLMDEAKEVSEKADAAVKAFTNVPQDTLDNLAKALTLATDAFNDAGQLIKDVAAAQKVYDDTPEALDSGNPKAAAKKTLDEKITIWTKAKADNHWSGSDSEILNMLEQKKAAALTAHTTKKNYEDAVKTAADKKKAFTDAENAWKNYTISDTTTLAEAVKSAQAEVDRTKPLYEAAKTAKEAKEQLVSDNGTLGKAYIDAKAKYDSASKSSFPYVYETSAAGDASVKVSWDKGSSTYAGSPDIVKKRTTNMNSKYSSVSDYIYFVAVPIKSRSTNDTHDIFGKITAKQTKGEKWEETLDISMEVGYENASDDEDFEDGLITEKAHTFKRNNGFDEETDYQFTFAAASDSSFVVNTVSQGSIVLAFNSEPIDKIDRKISNSYPGARTEYFNGNYASFNKTGTLYLSPSDGEDDYNVYAVDKSNNITSVNADWDDNEDAYAIRTRTLGRYFLSSKRLSNSFLSSGSSGSSSSGSGSGSGSGGSGSSSSGGLVVVPPPASSSKPASSYVPPATPSKPASSTSAPSSSSKPSSSEESSSDEEFSEPPEDEDASSEDIVDVDTSTDDTENPEKGGSALVWVLAIVGLLAAGGAVGFVVYSNKLKRRDDGYSEYDEDDNDFPDDDDR